MNCKYYDNDFETCKNGDCPYCADYCPVTENQEVCRYSDLDETEIAHRESLDHEKQDSQEALHALAEENQELKKQLAEVFGDIHRIQLIYGIENWEAAVALERLCEKYCAQSGNQCFTEGENHICKNFEWRGKGEKKA